MIISKIFHKRVLDFVNKAKNKGVKIISIFDDWNFDKNSKTDNTLSNLPLAFVPHNIHFFQSIHYANPFP